MNFQNLGLFSIFGIPEKFVTDNATAFTSKLFQTFYKVNGIVHVTSPPFHPQSNGLAERAVGLVKSNLKKSRLSHNPLPIETQLLKFLQKSHTTPLSDCGKSPSELIFKFPIRDYFSQIKRSELHAAGRLQECGPIAPSSQARPTTSTSTSRSASETEKSRDFRQQTRRKIIFKKRTNVSMNENHSDFLKNKHFEVGEKVYFYSTRLDDRWSLAKILEKISNLVYRIQIISTNLITTAHLDSLKRYSINEDSLHANFLRQNLDNSTSPNVDSSSNLPNVIDDNVIEETNRRFSIGNRRNRRSGLRDLPRFNYKL